MLKKQFFLIISRMLKFKKIIYFLGSAIYVSCKFPTEQKITRSRYLLIEVVNVMPSDLFQMNLEDLINSAKLTDHSI